MKKCLAMLLVTLPMLASCKDPTVRTWIGKQPEAPAGAYPTATEFLTEMSNKVCTLERSLDSLRTVMSGLHQNAPQGPGAVAEPDTLSADPSSWCRPGDLRHGGKRPPKFPPEGAEAM